MRRILSSLFLTLLLHGCASEVINATPVPSERLAKVYFIRKNLPGSKVATLRVVETDAARLADKDIVAINVPVGDTYIHLQFSDGTFFSFTLPVKAESPQYVLLQGTRRSLSESEQRAFHWRYSHEFHREAVKISQEEARKIANSLGRPLE